MARAIASRRTERVEARVTPEQKALFQRAADLAGLSLTDFIVTSVQAAAEDRIRTAHVITLSLEESLKLAEALLNPPEPNDALREAARRYRELIGE